MSATTHHEIHPDTEMLSAFAEQALNAKERSEVLGHLAVCGRCREIVALARDAAGIETAPARPGVLRPRAWWRSWGLVMAPAAAVVATAAIAIYVHERNIERGAETAKVERLRASERPAIPPPPTPQAPEQSKQPAAPRGVPTKKTARTAAVMRIPVAEPDEMSSAPPPESMNGLLPGRRGAAEDSMLEGHRRSDEALSPTGAAPEGSPPTEAAVYDEERMKHAEEAAEDRRQFAAKAPMSSSDGGSGSDKAAGGAPEKKEVADVSAQQIETQPAPQAGYLQLHGMRSMVNVPTGPYGIHLPSGRPAVSIASANHRMLAVDEKGALFLCEGSRRDMGKG